jgi:hypothetical protein
VGISNMLDSNELQVYACLKLMRLDLWYLKRN